MDNKYVKSNSTPPPCRAAGLIGIFNMGATCFMSVILQCFIHNPLLRNFYLGEGHQTSICTRENCLSCTMDLLFQEFYSLDKVEAHAATNVLQASWLSKQIAFQNLAGYDEQDAHEYFQ